MAGSTKQAGSSLKTKKPQCGNTEASGNEINFEEEIVMSNISTEANNVIPFRFESKPVRTLLIDNQPWFVAADVCASLGIGNVSLAVNGRADRESDGLDEDEKGIATVNTPSGSQEMLVVSESGLYALIFKSRKAEAKRFKKWVTAEVLPAIRKYGRYEDSKGVMVPMVDDLLGKSGALRLSNVMRCRVAKLDAEHQRSATAKLASAVHACFGIPRIELIPRSQFDAAANFVANYAIEGEYLGKANQNDKSALEIHFPVQALAKRRPEMVKLRGSNQAWLEVTIHDLRDLKGESTPCESILYALREAGYNVDGAWWELRTYRNKLRQLESFVKGLGTAIEEPHRYAISEEEAA
ncbi:Bro-N domain-containing protein [Pseudomonas mediterranea]|uniref:BRO-N domain-containing protein n=1 Tax=Pseudomonas mediterranea TaxID=183795 RepID=UPI000B20785F|nr:BRO family protein [Pseudomonas mediterranea]